MRIVPKINRRKSLLKLNQLLRSENLLLRKQLEVAAEQLQKKDQLVVPVEFMPEQFRKGGV
jgi:hypothetical protein